MADFTEVYQPLAGEDLYVLKPDLEAYFDSAERFWMALQQELEELAGW